MSEEMMPEETITISSGEFLELGRNLHNMDTTLGKLDLLPVKNVSQSDYQLAKEITIELHNGFMKIYGEHSWRNYKQRPLLLEIPKKYLYQITALEDVMGIAFNEAKAPSINYSSEPENLLPSDNHPDLPEHIKEAMDAIMTPREADADQADYMQAMGDIQQVTEDIDSWYQSITTRAPYVMQIQALQDMLLNGYLSNMPSAYRSQNQKVLAESKSAFNTPVTYDKTTGALTKDGRKALTAMIKQGEVFLNSYELFAIKKAPIDEYDQEVLSGSQKLLQELKTLERKYGFSEISRNSPK